MSLVFRRHVAFVTIAYLVIDQRSSGTTLPIIVVNRSGSTSVVLSPNFKKHGGVTMTNSHRLVQPQPLLLGAEGTFVHGMLFIWVSRAGVGQVMGAVANSKSWPLRYG
jgi:hypothetical protein